MRLFSKNTVLSSLWRALSCLFDWRGFVRNLIGKKNIDVCFITNMRDEIDRDNFLGNWRPKSGHFNGPRYYYRGVIGRTRALDVTAEEMFAESGRAKARELFVSACEWAEKKGAKVILLAAGTKRLFEGRVEELKGRFPGMIFTIGDNGTTLILEEETLEVLRKANLPRKAKIAVLGPYGFLGEEMLKKLLSQKYNVVGIGANKKHLLQTKEKYGIPVFSSFQKATQVDAVVACTHSEKVRITANNFDQLRKSDKKLLVIDVAEPSNLKKSEFRKIADKIIRIDSGNAYSSKLKYVLGPITYRLFRLSRGVTFGCFAETLAIGRALQQGKAMNGIDWFSVTDLNKRIVKNLFEESDGKGFRVPSHRSYGKLVKNFDLNLVSKAERESKFTGQIVCQKIGKALASLIL